MISKDLWAAVRFELNDRQIEEAFVEIYESCDGIRGALNFMDGCIWNITRHQQNDGYPYKVTFDDILSDPDASVKKIQDGLTKLSHGIQILKDAGIFETSPGAQETPRENSQSKYSPEELRKTLQENEKDFLEMLQEFLTQSEVEQ